MRPNVSLHPAYPCVHVGGDPHRLWWWCIGIGGVGGGGGSYRILQLSSISNGQVLNVYNCQLFQLSIRASFKCAQRGDSY